MPKKSEVALYIESMCKELKKLSEPANFELLVYLLNLAEQEAPNCRRQAHSAEFPEEQIKEIA